VESQPPGAERCDAGLLERAAHALVLARLVEQVDTETRADCPHRYVADRRRQMRVLGSWRRLVQRSIGVGPDDREQRRFQRALVQLRAVTDPELRQRVEQRLQRDPLGIEQQLAVAAQHAYLGEHAALVRQQRRVGATADPNRGDVV